MLRQIFHLKYASQNKANTKYLDPTYNEKRLWVCRLLTQFFIEEVLVISVDECNFRSDAVGNRKWHFRPLSGKKRSKVVVRRSLEPLFATDDMIN
jgi:hypothetical protein